tara:strand:- start:612 stop:1181 length:570 start_codon:yes stop_codon:yes gene_type:complete
MDTKPSIQQVDNFFPDDVASKVSEFITDYAAYRYGETDNREAPPTGLVADLFHWDRRDVMSTAPNHVKLIYNYFIKYIHEKYTGFWDTYQIYRLYVNCFAPKESAYFHTDSVGESDQWTFIYYPYHTFEYDKNQGGWTEFDLDGKIIGVPPFANSLTRFSSYVSHRATPFKDHHRFTIAIKCINKNELR